ncbi:MAG: MBL fold metallo-hydrolase, partial [Gemmatimonadales bacterium]
PHRAVFRRAVPAFAAPRAAASQLTITWIGHASALLQIGGVNVLTDPMWSACASPLPPLGPRRWVAPGVAFAALPPIDAVLLSHDHYDHLDDHTVRRLARAHPQAQWLVPLGLAPFVTRRGGRAVQELDWWQEAALGSLRVICAPAQHFSGRTPRMRGTTLWCSWALAAPYPPAGAERRIFFGGDTGHHPEFGEIGARCGPFDVALLPVGAYEPRWFMRYLHMNPEEAVAACQALGARAMVPIHWGTFKLTDEAMDEPPARARAAWAAAGLPAGGYHQLAHGETLEL